MSYFTKDPMAAIVADERIKPRPFLHYGGAPEILTVNLDLIASSLQRNLQNIFLSDNRVLKLYNHSSSPETIKHEITTDITAMVDYAIGCTYNRLRTILERNDITGALTKRMETECPVLNGMEFPAWISSTLGSIGPCHIKKGPRPRNTLVLYASGSSCAENYGRKTKPDFNDLSRYGSYLRLIDVLMENGVAISPIPHAPRGPFGLRCRSSEGCCSSYFPMIQPKKVGDTLYYYGCVDESEYENEDVARIALVTSDDGVTPFEQVGLMKPSGDDCYYQSDLGRCIDPDELIQILRYRIMCPHTH